MFSLSTNGMDTSRFEKFFRIRFQIGSSLHRKTKFLALLMFALVTALCMIISISIIAVTLPTKSVTSCELTFKPVRNKLFRHHSEPRTAVVGDVNNDHQTDIIVANFGTHSIGLFLSKSDGSFEQQTTYETGSGFSPYSIAVDDLNNDTFLDIVVAYYEANSIGIFLGYGNGSFQDQYFFSTDSSHPWFIICTDFNHDYRIDLAIANHGTESIGIAIGDGHGNFQKPIIVHIGYDSIPYALALGDFNHDANTDIAIANYGTNSVDILLGNGDGTFNNPETSFICSNSKPVSVISEDLNHDGHVDIAVATYGTGDVNILFGIGNGSFQLSRTYSLCADCHPQFITVADLNHDGNFDLVLTEPNRDQINIFLGDGNGTFRSSIVYELISNSKPNWVIAIDLNHDLNSDLVVINNGNNNVQVLVNFYAEMSIKQTQYYDGPSGKVTSIVVDDFNNDQIPDIAFNTPENIHVLRGFINGTFDRGAIYPAIRAGLQYICTGDLNNDRIVDIIGTNRESNSVEILLGQRNGTFATAINYFLEIYTNPWWTAIGDVNNDNRADIVTANTGASSVGIHLGDGNGNFTNVGIYSTGAGSIPYSVALGDLNNDRFLDIVVADGQRSNGKVRIFLGQGNGNFTTAMISRTGTASFGINLVDLNQDTYLDIVVTNVFDGNIGILLGYGNGMFAPQITYSISSSSQPYGIVIGDFNNDLLKDIAVSAFGDDQILIFLSNGDGSIQLSKRYSTGYGSKPYGLAVGDFDGNNKLDIAATLFGNGDVVTLVEYYAPKFSNQSIYSTGSTFQPSFIMLDNFDDDHRLDLVIVSSVTSEISVLTHSKQGIFDQEKILTLDSDSYPQQAITCDLNQNGQTDIISVNTNANNINIFLDVLLNSSVSQTFKYSTGNGSKPRAIASGDLNNDGRLDLVTANSGTNNIGILHAYNYTTFIRHRVYSNINSIEPISVIVDDFNHDNLLDIAVVFLKSSQLGILLGHGNGSFADMILYSTGINAGTYGVNSGDFNNDNHSDLVVTNSVTAEIGIFLGFGNGTFGPMVSFFTGTNSAPSVTTIGYVNNDTNLDIIVANYQADRIQIFIGDGNGYFSMSQTYFTGQESKPRAITSGDFNHDGFLDIVVAINNVDGVAVLIGNSDGTFQNRTIFSLNKSWQPYWIAVGYFNNDSHLDIVTANYNANNVAIFLGYGNGSFAPFQRYSAGDGALPTCLVVADFNYDNISDIALANYGSSAIVVLFGIGDGSFLRGTYYSTDSRTQPHGLAMGDFNHDGQLDIVVTVLQSNAVQVWLGSTGEVFGSITTYSTGIESNPYSVATGDLNNDGRFDIAVANYGTGDVVIFSQNRNGSFIITSTYATGQNSGLYSIVLADLNRDHQLDIIVINSQFNDIIILIHQNGEEFIIENRYSTGVGSHPHSLAINDFNNDDIMDMAVANSGTSNILLFYGYGNITFGNETVYPIRYGCQPYSIAVDDLNADGWKDMIVACFGAKYIEVLLKTCSN